MFDGTDGLFDFTDEFDLIDRGDCLPYINEFITYCCPMLNWSQF